MGGGPACHETSVSKLNEQSSVGTPTSRYTWKPRALITTSTLITRSTDHISAWYSVRDGVRIRDRLRVRLRLGVRVKVRSTSRPGTAPRSIGRYMEI